MTDAQKMRELLPCPWCGNPPRIWSGAKHHSVSCGNEYCPVQPSADTETTLDNAKHNWNTRTASNQLTAGAGVRDALEAAQVALSDGAFDGPFVEDALKKIAIALAAASPQDYAARSLPVDEEELAKCLYEAEYDGEAYPWHRQRSDEQLTYREQAKKVLRDYAVTRSGCCTCQEQHRRGYCTERGCPYSVTRPDSTSEGK
jgi:hypothetical protein